MINGAFGCVNQSSAYLATDQRGRPRPPSPPNPFNSTCDIGAFGQTPDLATLHPGYDASTIKLPQSPLPLFSVCLRELEENWIPASLG
jgi:hypothetical protein